MISSVKNLRTDVLHVTVDDTWGGRELILGVTPEFSYLIRRMEQYIQEMDREQALRDQHPSLASSWKEYQMMKQMVEDCDK